MALIVQKYGGTSLMDTQRIGRCAARAVAAAREGNQVVVVVSAMGHTTDHLIDLAREITPSPRQRELDLLLATGEQVSAALMAMALHAAGAEAVSLTARHLGIVTDPVHCNAKIQSIDADRIRRHLAAGQIVVAPGFQGITIDGDVTTLGRGGSDTTAVAIGAALGVTDATGVCEIYTDVDGVYTADPRLVPHARKLSRISYGEMAELAALGAGVMHTRAVLAGQRHHVPIHVRHSARPDAGTMIVKETPDMEDVTVVGCALTRDLVRVSIRRLPNRPGMQSVIFEHIAAAGILVDDIMQIESDERADVSFTAPGPNLAELERAVREALDALGASEAQVAVQTRLAKVSAVGVGMRTHTSVASKMFAALGEAGIRIANITTSEIKISCIVGEDDGPRALNLVHDAFGLGAAEAVEAGAMSRD